MKPEPTFPRCNARARHYAPNGFRRCPQCLTNYGREGFAEVPSDEPSGRCDEPLWYHDDWVAWVARARPKWNRHRPTSAP